MCEQAEEIQKGHKWKRCDMYVVKGFLNQGTLYYDKTSYNLEAAGMGIKKLVKSFVWLPTQEQLQERVSPILKDRYNKYCDLGRMNRVGNWIIRIFFGFVGGNVQDGQNNPIWNHSNNINELWLAFVMKECWNKIWDGNKWK